MHCVARAHAMQLLASIKFRPYRSVIALMLTTEELSAVLLSQHQTALLTFLSDKHPTTNIFAGQTLVNASHMPYVMLPQDQSVEQDPLWTAFHCHSPVHHVWLCIKCTFDR